jgi:hypothetical protein
LRQCDARLVGYGLAAFAIAFRDEKEGITIGDHAWLSRQGCRDPIPSRSGCHRAAGLRESGRSTRHADTVVCLCPYCAAVIAYSRVPGDEVRHREDTAEFGGDLLAVVICHCVVEVGARLDEAFLCRRWLGCYRATSLRRRGGSTGHADAVICLCPYCAAVIAYGGIPRDKFRRSESTVLLTDLFTAIVRNCVVEVGA